MMKAATTYNHFAFNTVRLARPSLLRRLRCFFAAMLETRNETPHDLPADMAARLYL